MAAFHKSGRMVNEEWSEEKKRLTAAKIKVNTLNGEAPYWNAHNAMNKKLNKALSKDFSFDIFVRSGIIGILGFRDAVNSFAL